MADIDYIINNKLEDTGFDHTLHLISGKYKMQVLYALFLNHRPIRYNQLKRVLQPISFKSLTNTLKDLVNADLVTRTEYPEIPPRVEYALTSRGQSLLPVMDALCAWGECDLQTKPAKHPLH